MIDPENFLMPRDRQPENENAPGEILHAGSWAHKIGFSDSTSSKIYVWCSSDRRYLHWGMSRSDPKSYRVDLSEAVGVLFGPCTTAFTRAINSRGNIIPWCCLSLLFVGRTLDLCFDIDIADKWFLELQEISNGVHLATRTQILRQKIWMKIQFKAHRLNRSLAVHIRHTALECYKASTTEHQSTPSIGSQMKIIQSLRKELFIIRDRVACMTRDAVSEIREDILSHIRTNGPPQVILEKCKYEMDRLKIDNRKMRDELIALKGNIRVFARLRPLLGYEVSSYSPIDDSPLISSSPDRISLYSVREMRRKQFIFDYVFGPHQGQEEVFREVSPLVDSCVDGYNVCIFAYGATNSGKSYTMEGSLDNPGINHLACQRVFQQVHFPPGRFIVSVSVCQIYNETVMDLLNNMTELHFRMAEKLDAFNLVNVTKMKVNSINEAMGVLQNASLMRTTKSTNLNGLSSRSHSIVTIYVEDLAAGTCGKLNLVDLAGSENLHRSGATGDTLRETQYINKSLSALGDVIHALIEKSSKRMVNMHIPFRNSKLTMLLRDSLSGNSKTLMIVQISPSDADLSETSNSLTFGQRVRSVEVGRPYRNQ